MVAAVLGVKLIDWIVIIVYLVGITAVGVWAARKVRSASTFFMGERKFGKLLMLFFNFGTGTHSDQAVSVAAKTYRAGASGIWYQWLWLFATPFYWIAAPIFRRMRAVTTADYFETRYSPSVSVLFALVGMLQLMVSIGIMLKGTSAMITAISGGTTNGSIKFDGVDDYVDCGPQPDTSDHLTVALWFNAAKIQNSSLIDKFPDDDSGAGWTIKITEDQKVIFRIGSKNNYSEVRLPSAYTSDTWRHLICTFEYDANSHQGRAKIYYNGKLAADRNDIKQKLGPNPIPLQFAASSKSDPDANFVGELDDIVIFKQALDDDKAFQLYHEGGKSFIADQSKIPVLGHWNLDESTGSVAADSGDQSPENPHGRYPGNLSQGPVWQPSGGGINPNLAIIAMTIMFVVYGLAGGISAAVYTDFIQGILTIVLSFLILPFALHAVGGFDGLRLSIEKADMLEIVAPGEITAFFIAIVALNALTGWAVQPHTMANCAAGKSEIEGRFGVTFGMFCKRICTIAWMLTGLCAIALFTSRELGHVDYAYGLMAYKLLPAIAPGLIGIFLASMLAAVMSSCDAFMVTSSALFTKNIYRRFLVTDKPEKHYVLIGRIVAVIIVLFGIYFAFNLETVIHGLEIFWQVSAMMGIAFWVGLFWRRATAAGAWAATLASFACFLFTSKVAFGDFVLWDFNNNLAHYLPDFMLWQEKLYLPWKMIFYLSIGLVTLIVVSLLTRRVDADKLDRFYNCLRTPVGQNETETEPFTLPAGVNPALRNSIIKHPDFEVPRPTWIGMIGFFGSWLAVALLIGFVFWILSP